MRGGSDRSTPRRAVTAADLCTETRPTSATSFGGWPTPCEKELLPARCREANSVPIVSHARSSSLTVRPGGSVAGRRVRWGLARSLHDRKWLRPRTFAVPLSRQVPTWDTLTGEADCFLITSVEPWDSVPGVPPCLGGLLYGTPRRAESDAMPRPDPSGRTSRDSTRQRDRDLPPSRLKSSGRPALVPAGHVTAGVHA